MIIEILLWVAGAMLLLLGGLLMIIGYFLKELHKDFKGVKDALVLLIERTARNEEKGRSGYRLLDQRLDEHEQRIERLEEDATI